MVHLGHHIVGAGQDEGRLAVYELQSGLKDTPPREFNGEQSRG